MTAHSRDTGTHPGRSAQIFRGLLVLIFMLSLVGIQSPEPVQAAPEAPQATAAAAWTAYNDCVVAGSVTNPTNTSTIVCYTNNTTGSLKNFDTGANVATVTVTTSGSVGVQNTSDVWGSIPNSGTDAYNTFNGKASIIGGVRMYNTSASYVTLTISGLSADKTYTFATTANRNDSTYTGRKTTFTISGVDAATNASTGTIDSQYATSFVTGYNTVNGYVARWQGINPGSDATFAVKFTNSGSETTAYGPSVFMLQEEGSATPTIITTGTLTAFSSQPGVPSTAQTYTVSGSNLTADISISAPAGFELSTDGANYDSGLTLPQSGGSVPATTVYVRLNSATEGALSGDIAHTSAGATTKNVAASGAVLYVYTLTAGNNGNGNVTLSPAGGSYNNGTTVTLTPAPNSGYAFGSWSGANAGDIVNTGGVYTIVVNGNKSVTANFIPSTTVTFQYGANSYTGTIDTFIRGTTEGNTNFHTNTGLEWDDNSGTTTDEIALIRFTGLFNSEGDSIPDGATITSASLTYRVTDLTGSSTADGDPANVYESLVDWVGASVTYNNFGGEAGVQADEYRATPVVSAPATARSTAYTIDVTASLQRWSTTPAENLGWIFRPTDDDGVTIIPAIMPPWPTIRC